MRIGNYTIWLVPLALLLIYWLGDPFNQTISAKTLSLSQLSAAQRTNISIAASAIDGLVLKPEEEFSFNKTVGPRTSARGYSKAPSYLGSESSSTFGGGICLVSSAIYQAALEAGLQITQRVPHLATIRSVPPGLDATVWYGGPDLCFRNNLTVPLRLSAQSTGRELLVKLMGRPSDSTSGTAIRRVKPAGPDKLVVEVHRRQGDSAVLVSRDLYRLPLPFSQKPASN